MTCVATFSGINLLPSRLNFIGVTEQAFGSGAAEFEGKIKRKGSE